MGTSIFKNRGVLTILIWILLNNICDPAIAVSITDGSTRLFINIAASAFLFFLACFVPLVTVFADLKFKGFYFTIGSLVVGFIVTVLYFLQNYFYIHPTPHVNQAIFEIVLDVSSPLYTAFRSLFDVFVILFGVDLMPDASSNELSSFMWWLWFFKCLGQSVTSAVGCTGGTLISKSKLLISVDITHCILLILIVLLCVMFRKWLCSAQNRKQNAIKLIAGVLYYAKVHKYPQSQSAFTYCGDAKVSRIDFGKKQYGGPYEEEDVEAVKAFFRLLPYLFCMCLIYFPFIPLGRLEQNQSFAECLIGSTYFTEYVIAVVMILFHQLVLKRYCLWQEKFSMMTKVGFGILLSFISKALYLVTELVLQYTMFDNINSTTSPYSCKYNTTAGNSDFNTRMYFMIFPQVIGSVGAVLCLVISFEFIFAQSPYSMRGLILGFVFSLKLILEQLGWGCANILKSILPADVLPSCNTYIYILNLVVMLICLISFGFVRKWYKYRLRNIVFPHYSAAEKYYTRLIPEESNDSNYGSTTTTFYGSEYNAAN